MGTVVQVVQGGGEEVHTLTLPGLVIIDGLIQTLVGNTFFFSSDIEKDLFLFLRKFF